jgi:hypothetical protein
MKNSNDTIGNRTRDLPACSAVPQPTAPPRAPPCKYVATLFSYNFIVLISEDDDSCEIRSSDSGVAEGTVYMCVECSVVSDISKDRLAFVCMLKQSKKTLDQELQKDFS